MNPYLTTWLSFFPISDIQMTKWPSVKPHFKHTLVEIHHINVTLRVKEWIRSKLHEFSLNKKTSSYRFCFHSSSSVRSQQLWAVLLIAALRFSDYDLPLAPPSHYLTPPTPGFQVLILPNPFYNLLYPTSPLSSHFNTGHDYLSLVGIWLPSMCMQISICPQGFGGLLSTIQIQIQIRQGLWIYIY